jgi:hypothetical protein
VGRSREEGYKHLSPMEQFKVSHQLKVYLLYCHPLDRKLGGSRNIPDMVTGRGIPAPLVKIKSSFSPFIVTLLR